MIWTNWETEYRVIYLNTKFNDISFDIKTIISGARLNIILLILIEWYANKFV